MGFVCQALARSARSSSFLHSSQIDNFHRPCCARFILWSTATPGFLNHDGLNTRSSLSIVHQVKDAVVDYFFRCRQCCDNRHMNHKSTDQTANGYRGVLQHGGDFSSSASRIFLGQTPFIRTVTGRHHRFRTRPNRWLAAVRSAVLQQLRWHLRGPDSATVAPSVRMSFRCRR